MWYGTQRGGGALEIPPWLHPTHSVYSQFPSALELEFSFGCRHICPRQASLCIFHSGKGGREMIESFILSFPFVRVGEVLGKRLASRWGKWGDFWGCFSVVVCGKGGQENWIFWWSQVGDVFVLFLKSRVLKGKHCPLIMGLPNFFCLFFSTY